MPDPTGAKPLGVVTRHAADWFTSELCMGAWNEFDAFVGPGLMYIAIGFLNQDSNGRVMRVYGASSSFEGGGGAIMFYVNGSIGSQVNTCKNIRPDRPAPNVSIWSEHQQTPAGNPNPFNFGDMFGIVACSGFDSGTFLSPFPLFIVPVGFSLVATNQLSSNVGGLGLWFEMSNQ